MNAVITHEKARGCGYRKPGKNGVGLYLIGKVGGVGCERLPFPLVACPCCGGGIKPARGYTSIEPAKMFAPDVEPVCTGSGPAHDHSRCAMCAPPDGKHGLMWVGSMFYSPKSFMSEALARGVSKRIAMIPRDLKLGETIVYLGHRSAISDASDLTIGDDPVCTPGVFCAFRPTSIDVVVDSIRNIPTRAEKLADVYGEAARIVQVIRDESIEQLDL